MRVGGRGRPRSQRERRGLDVVANLGWRAGADRVCALEPVNRWHLWCRGDGGGCMAQRYVLAIDQGTTGSTAMVFDDAGKVRGRGYSEFPQHYPKPGWVEHDAEEIWSVSLQGHAGQALRSGASSRPPTSRRSASPTSARRRCCGTARTGKPVHRAIVWQDRRTADDLRAAEGRRRRADGARQDRPGARRLLLRHQAALAARPRARPARARARDLAFGTIDTWLMWKLTGGRVHVTDYTNASRTLLFDIHRRGWDAELLRAARRARATMLPQRGAVERRRRHDRPAPCSAPRCRSPASPAISRRRCSARPASSPAW